VLRYYLFYKPFQVLSQFSKEGDKQTLADFLKEIPKDVYPVGRLDYDSEGLLLLTNDKQLAHQLLEPKFEHKRTYWVQIEGTITDEAVAQLQNGVLININGKQHKTKRAIVERMNEPYVAERNPPIRFRKNIPVSWIAITLTEGKNRQVRRMTAAVGYPTLRLIRYSIGNVNIGELEPGKYIDADVAIKQALLAK
jgi:23S rRNA pseudouridine2457 synthase